LISLAIRRVRRLRRQIVESVDLDSVTSVLREGLDSVRHAVEEAVALRASWAQGGEARPAAVEEAPQDDASSSPDDPLLDRRRKAADIVERYAGLAAVNAFNPIPGLDFGLDIGIMLTMARLLADLHGLNQQQLPLLEDAPHHRPLAGAAERLTHEVAERLVLATVQRLAPEFLARRTSKWLPLVGNVISARIGYRIVSGFGRALSNRCEELAREGAPLSSAPVCLPDADDRAARSALPDACDAVPA
jgi:uncharacterized protein (DUF697 family)